MKQPFFIKIKYQNVNKLPTLIFKCVLPAFCHNWCLQNFNFTEKIMNANRTS